MKTIIFNVPSNYFMQAPGAARLAGYLKKRGHDVECKNCNYDFFYDLFKKESMEKLLLDKRKLAPGGEDGKENYCRDLITRTDKANQDLHLRYTRLPYDDFIKNIKTLQEAVEVINKRCAPVRIDLYTGLSTQHSCFASEEIVSAAYQEKNNLMLAYFKKNVIPWLVKENPDLVGVSMPHANEFIPGFTLIRLIKEVSDARIIIGGAAITLLRHAFKGKLAVDSLVDFIALGPGEYTMQALIENFRKPELWHTIPNMLFKKKGCFIKTDSSKIFNLNEAECAHVYEPRPGAIVLLETSQNCYWGKCSFCNWPLMHACLDGEKPSYQEMQQGVIDKQLDFIKREYDPLCVRLSNSVTSPQGLKMIIDVNKKYNLKFFSYIRAEKEFTSLEFCAKIQKGGVVALAFGVESASKRINDLYHKGVHLEYVEEIVRNCSKLGILVCLFCMINFPDETEEEMLQSYEYFKRLKERYSCLLFMSNFRVHNNLDTWHKHQNFGIPKVRKRSAGARWYLDRSLWHGRIMARSKPFKVWIRGQEDMPLYYTYTSFLGRRADNRKDRLMLKILKELNPNEFLDDNFLKLFTTCRNATHLN